MPLTHVRNFSVRYSECDAHGELSCANYLRYMQEAAFGASAAAGYDLSKYEAMRRYWLIRETDVEYLRPVYYGDTVQVKTWVADFRRVRSCRAYDFRLVGSDELVAVAQTDWAFLDRDTGRPALIPSELRTAFLPEGGPAPASARPHFLSLPTPSSGVFRMRRQVEWGDLDSEGHMNNAVYLAYLEDCRIRAEAMQGWAPARTREHGFAIVARRHSIEYQQPAVLGDLLGLTTWMSKADDTSMLRHFVLERVGDGSPVARASTLWVCTDLGQRKQIPIPEVLLADLEPGFACT